MQRSSGRLFVGLALLLVGAAFLLRNLDVFSWEFEHYYLGWPTWVFIIGLAITISARGSFWGFSIMIVGAIFFAARYYHYPAGEIFADIWPIFLILFGLSIVFGHKKNKSEDSYKSENSWVDYSDDTIDLTSIFTENKRKIVSQNFKKAKVTTLFASTEIDLRNAKPAPNCVIECDTIFGGTEIIVPSTWEVINQSTAVFAGTDDDRRKSAPVEGEEKMRITVKGFVMFGGLEIKS